MKRNDIVRKDADGWFYGRVVRVLDPETVLWICCGLHIHVTKKEALVVDNAYGGFIERKTVYAKGNHKGIGGDEHISETSRLRRLPTLRRLKQLASRYHGRNVWRTALDYEFLRRDGR